MAVAGGSGRQHPATRVLVIDDAPELVRMVQRTLEAEGFAVLTAHNGTTGLTLTRDEAPDVVVLDVGLPDLEGIEVCRQLRTFSNAYVIMLTARTEEVHRLVGLSVGADDYMTKPFSPSELVARIQAMLRRPRMVIGGASSPGAVARVGELTLDPATREVRLADEVVELSKLEYEILAELMASPHQSLSRAQLLDAVWGPTWFGDDHLIDVHVSNLRRKLGDDPRRPRYVCTVRGHGFRLGGG